MKRIIHLLIPAFVFFLALPIAASAEITWDGKDSGSVQYGDGAGLEGAPYFPSVMAELDLGVYRNGMVYTGNDVTVRFKSPFKMYVNILDFSPDGYVTLLLNNFYTAPGSNVLDWYVQGTVTGNAGREYLYLIVSNQALDSDYLEDIATNPGGYEPEDNIYATDIESFQVLQGAGGYGAADNSPFIPIEGTPLEVYPTYYLFPRDSYYNYPHFNYYYWLPSYYPGGGKYYSTRIRVGPQSYYAYPQGGVVRHNLVGLHTSGNIVNNYWQIIPGTFLKGTFNLGVVNNPLGLVIHPYLPTGFHRSFQDWDDDFTFEVWINDEFRGHGSVVNDGDGQPTFYVPLEPGLLNNGDNNFEIRVPQDGSSFQVERVEVVESDEPEEVEYKGIEDFRKPAGVD